MADGDSLDEKVGDLYKASLIPGHLIMKLKLGAKFEPQMLEPSKMNDLLKASPKEIAHTFLQEDYLVHL